MVLYAMHSENRLETFLWLYNSRAGAADPNPFVNHRQSTTNAHLHQQMEVNARSSAGIDGASPPGNKSTTQSTGL